MDRKKYLELCQKNAVQPNSVILIYQGGRYYPLALKIWFNGNGETNNTAEMVDCSASRSKIYCDIRDVCEP